MGGTKLTAAERKKLKAMSDKASKVRGTTGFTGSDADLRKAAEEYGPMVLDLLARGVSEEAITEASGVNSWQTIRARLQRHNLVRRPPTVAAYKGVPREQRGPSCGHDPERFVSRTRQDGRVFVDCLECKRQRMHAARNNANSPQPPPTIPRKRAS